MNMRSITVALSACLFASASAMSQDDLRDRVVKKDGRVVEGRVVEPFATEELLVLQGGRRVRVPRADVAELQLVADRVREFCERRRKQKDSPRAQWYLVDWARSQGLNELARLQAMALVLADDTHAAAHEFLGHEQTGKGWMWEHRGKRVTRDQLEAQLQKQPLDLRGERFVLRCDADLRTNVDALLDLEQLGAAWFEQFGKELLLREVLDPIRVVTYRNVDAFEKWGFRPVPYFVPPPHADEGRTFYAGPAPTRPERLFFVGVQGLLYRTMIGEVNQQSDRDRVAPWLEVGLGGWFEARMQGPAGFAGFGAAKDENLTALQALARPPRLPHLLQLPMYGGFYLMDDTATAVHWSAATMFVTWLLDADKQPVTRTAFLHYVREALAERKGTSSSVFDAAMGQRIETLEQPWIDWLGKKARQ